VFAQVNGSDVMCSGQCPGDSITVNGGSPTQIVTLNAGPTVNATIGPVQPWQPTRQQSWLNNYVTQVGCEAGAIASQGEPIFASTLGVLYYGGKGSYGVSAAFFAAYTAQLLNIRHQCVTLAWGSGSK
jgi:hypothetical protein